ncbi:MAG: TetR-like C-terminal domain-containing protein [Ruminiclostridium sp.]
MKSQGVSENETNCQNCLTEQPNVVAYTTAYLSYGLYGWIEEWFKRGMQETPKEMDELWKLAQ